MTIKRQQFQATQTVVIDGDVTEFKAGMQVRLLRADDYTDAELIGILLDRHAGQALEAVTRALYTVALERCGGVQVRAGELLGVTKMVMSYQKRLLVEGE